MNVLGLLTSPNLSGEEVLDFPYGDSPRLFGESKSEEAEDSSSSNTGSLILMADYTTAPFLIQSQGVTVFLYTSLACKISFNIDLVLYFIISIGVSSDNSTLVSVGLLVSTSSLRVFLFSSFFSYLRSALGIGGSTSLSVKGLGI